MADPTVADFSPSSALTLIIFVSLAPFLAVMVTSFTKIVVVLSLLRNAIGLQQTPPSIVLNGLALVLSLYVMSPVINQAVGSVPAPTAISGNQGTQYIYDIVMNAREPLRDFMIKHTSPRERAYFLRTARKLDHGVTAPTDRDFLVVLPAFTVSELTQAFQLGFMVFLPFLVVDLVVANVLMAMGMQMMTPTTVSLPFKLLLFVMVDGWARLSHALVASYT